jgi:hypothetical protein
MQHLAANTCKFSGFHGEICSDDGFECYYTALEWLYSALSKECAAILKMDAKYCFEMADITITLHGVKSQIFIST